MAELQPSYETNRSMGRGSRPGYSNLAVIPHQEPTPLSPPLTDWEKSRPFIFDVDVGSIKSNLDTDFYFSSPSGDRFCLFSSKDSENSKYLQQETKIFLTSLNQQQDPSMIRDKFAKFYSQVNNLDMAPARGVFCLTIDRGRKPTMIIANCGGFVYLLRPSLHQPYNLGDRSNPGSFGVDSNPDKLFISSVKIQKGDLVMVTPDTIDDETREKLTRHLRSNFKKTASTLAKTCSEIIRESTFNETSALIVSVRHSSNDSNENSVDRRYVATHRKPQLKDFLPFHKK